MNITNQEQLALLAHIKKRANRIFDNFVGTTILFENKTIFQRSSNGQIAQYSIWIYNTIFNYDKWVTQKRNELLKQGITGKEANKIISNYIQNNLLKAWKSILLRECARLDPQTNNVIPFDNEMFNLLKKSSTDSKLLEVVKWTLSQITIISNNVLVQENQAISQGILNYNINTSFRKLYNNAKKLFKSQVSTRYENEKIKLSPKNAKYGIINQ